MYKRTNNELSGYASIDKPWLKWYDENALKETIPSISLHEYIYRENKDRLDNIAVSFFEKTITYGEVFDNIEIVYKAFLSYGIKKGDIVSVCIPNIPEAIYIFYALNKIGAICNYVDPRANMNVMAYHIRIAKSELLITISDCYEIFKKIKKEAEIKHIAVLNVVESLNKYNGIDIADETDYTWEQFINAENDYKIEQFDVDDNCPACILHTGGTTGTPKGALLSNKNFHSLVKQWKYLGLPYEAQKTLLSLMPPFVSFGLTANMHVPLCYGMELILIPEYNPLKVVDQIAKYHPNCIPASPAHWEEILVNKRIRRMDLSFLEIAFVGGDIISTKLERGLNKLFEETNANICLINAYGMTETTTAISVPFNEKVRHEGSVGVPLPQTVVGIFDDDCNELKYGELGEICVRSNSVMLEYYKSDETEQTLILHNDGNKWMHTGDMGVISKDGILYIKGRKKRIIIRYDGIKIYPVEVENVIMQMSGVRKCIVVGKKDKRHLQGSFPVAYIVTDSKEKDIIIQRAKDYSLDHIIDYAVPEQFFVLEDIPFTANGKIDYRFLENKANGSM